MNTFTFEQKLLEYIEKCALCQRKEYQHKDKKQQNYYQIVKEKLATIEFPRCESCGYCCSCCAAQVGYLHYLNGSLEQYAELFDEKKGFLSKNGCKLPRKMRSITCLTYTCGFSLADQENQKLIESLRPVNEDNFKNIEKVARLIISNAAAEKKKIPYKPLKY